MFAGGTGGRRGECVAGRSRWLVGSSCSRGQRGGGERSEGLCGAWPWFRGMWGLAQPKAGQHHRQLTSSSRSGSENSATASATRMRQPPDSAAVGCLWRSWLKPRPAGARGHPAPAGPWGLIPCSADCRGSRCREQGCPQHPSSRPPTRQDLPRTRLVSVGILVSENFIARRQQPGQLLRHGVCVRLTLRAHTPRAVSRLPRAGDKVQYSAQTLVSLESTW